MKPLAQKVYGFLVSEDGPVAVEYGIMLMLVVMACFIAINSVGVKTQATFGRMAASMPP